MVKSLAIVAALAVAGQAVRAQEPDMPAMMMDGLHITMTPHWEEKPGDRARADSIVRIARAAVERYQDVSAAEAAGFKRFAPQVRHQRVYHYSSTAAALKARFTFDPASPTSLLYQEDGSGRLRLVGVMYTMPAGASFEQLDRRIPLSIAHWHQHTNICLPPKADDPAVMLVHEARFGPRGSIASETACQSAGGRWVPRMFGWMVHVNLFAATPDGVWQDDPGGMRHH